MGLTLSQAVHLHTQYLIARNLSHRTITGYKEVFNDLHKLIGDPPLTDITSDHITTLLVNLLNRKHIRTGNNLKPATAEHRYRKLKAFFNWTTQRAFTTSNPMRDLPAPKLPETTIPVLTTRELKALLRTCNGHSFRDRRDRAIIRILIDNGLRRFELAGLQLEDVDLANRSLRVNGKGQKQRYVPLGLKSIDALQRYLQHRQRHPKNQHNALWLGHRGPIQPNGIYQILKARAQRAGLHQLYTHRFRHTWAHRWLLAGGSEIDAMTIAGWTTNRMLHRYARSAAQERAHLAHRKIAPGDSI